MDATVKISNEYLLGNEPDELVRLDRQAAAIDGATRLLLGTAGITTGMRVLDLGTGLGHVARIAGELVGPEGACVGIDRSTAPLGVARQRAHEAGERHVSFLDGDVNSWLAPEAFDAVVGRLLLFHVADPAAVVRHHLGNLRPGGLFVALDFDIGAARTEPMVPLVADALRWIIEAFEAAGAWPRIGARLAVILEDAGVQNITSFGVQNYLRPGDPSAAALVAGVVRTLAPSIVARQIATAEEIGIDTLQERINVALERAGAVLMPPTLVGAWGRSPRPLAA